MENILYLKKIEKFKLECSINGKEKLIIDATEDYGGDGKKYSPLDLMLFSLGSCIGITITKFYPFKDLNIQISADMEGFENTSIFKDVKIEIYSSDNVNKEQLEKILKAAIPTCPVHTMFKSFCNIEIIFNNQNFN